jgi:hypothetical protein
MTDADEAHIVQPTVAACEHDLAAIGRELGVHRDTPVDPPQLALLGPVIERDPRETQVVCERNDVSCLLSPRACLRLACLL